MQDSLNVTSSRSFEANSIYNGQPIRPAGSQPAGTTRVTTISNWARPLQPAGHIGLPA